MVDGDAAAAWAAAVGANNERMSKFSIYLSTKARFYLPPVPNLNLLGIVFPLWASIV